MGTSKSVWAALIAFVGGVVLLTVALGLGGCNAGTSADLLSYDAIQQANGEVRKGVAALDESVRSSESQTQERVLSGLSESIVIAVGRAGIPEANAVEMAASITGRMRVLMSQMVEQDRRRQDIVDAVMDNIAFITETCDNSKAFVIYRADIGTQWKQYLEAQARARTKSVANATIGAKP